LVLKEANDFSQSFIRDATKFGAVAESARAGLLLLLMLWNLLATNNVDYIMYLSLFAIAARSTYYIREQADFDEKIVDIDSFFVQLCTELPYEAFTASSA
jgi:hypothetical protein